MQSECDVKTVLTATEIRDDDMRVQMRIEGSTGPVGPVSRSAGLTQIGFDLRGPTREAAAHFRSDSRQIRAAAIQRAPLDTGHSAAVAARTCSSPHEAAEGPDRRGRRAQRRVEKESLRARSRAPTP